MDCPTEERMVRMALEPHANIRGLEFDLVGRKLTVLHTEGHDAIHRALDTLALGTTFVSTEMTDAAPTATTAAADESSVLKQVLVINFVLFLIELGAGLIASSMGLVADSLDMLADSIVYGLSLYAVGRSMTQKKTVARVSGYFQGALALLGFIEVVRRFAGAEEVPSFTLMIGISLLALIGNAASLWLLQRTTSTEAHIEASRIFTSNDVIVNLGVIAAGLLVLLTHSPLPDLLVGTIVFAVVARGAYRILRLAA